MIALFALLMLAELCVPARKAWPHELVAYPGLALLAGSALLPAARWLDAHRKPAVYALAAAALAAALLAPRIGRIVDGKPCVGASEFGAALDELKRGEAVLVVSSPTSWGMLASLAAERRLEPQPLAALPPASGGRAQVAIVQDSLLASAPGWTIAARARGWTLLRSSAPTAR